MRRAQSVRHYARSSLAHGVDDLGILREGEDSVEDVLRKQLMDKERECDKVRFFLYPTYLKRFYNFTDWLFLFLY